MKALLDKGASPNVTGGLFYRPLQAAACMGHREIVHLLIEATAEVNAKGGALSTALGAAAAQGHLDVAVTLLEAGANVNIPDPWRFGGQRSDPLFLSVAKRPSTCLRGSTQSRSWGLPRHERRPSINPSGCSLGWST